MKTFTPEEEAVLKEHENESVSFEIQTTTKLDFSIFTLQGEIERVKSDIELSKNRIVTLTEKQAQLEAKLDEVKEKILTDHIPA